MIDTPFGTYDSGYYDEDEGVYDSAPSVRDKLAEADRLFDLLAESDEDEDTEPECPSNSTTVTEPPATAKQPLVPEKAPGGKVRFLSDLVDHMVVDGKLLLDEGKRAFTYREEGGYYKPVTNLEAYLANVLPSKTTRSLHSRDIRELVERLSWEQRIRCSPDDFNSNPQLVNLGGGVFNLESLELTEHDPSYRFTYQIHASYLTDAAEISCPTFEKFCQTSLDGDPVKRQLLLEFIGYICTDSTAGKCALFFKGQPNSGKSVMSSFIARLFDKELVSNIPLHELGDRFCRAELDGKKLNVAGEVAGRALRDIELFKKATGNDSINGEFKGKDLFSFVACCKLLFSGNTLPTTKEVDATAAFVNRIRVLLFNSSVAPEDQDKQLLDKLWDERDSIVTLALQAAQKLMNRNFIFTCPEDSKKFLDAFELRGNALGGFLEECCILEVDARVFNIELYGAYTAYCKRNGLEVASKHTFYELLSGVPNVYAKRVRIGTESRQGHMGIALKKEMPDCGTLEQNP